MTRLHGKLALVTGGAGAGIGSATCRRLATDGATVIVTDRHAERTEQTVATLRGEGLDVVGFPMDVCDHAAVDSVLARVVSAHGRPIEVLVNSAAVALYAPMEQTTAEDWQRVLAADLVAPWYLTRAVLPGMKAIGGGSIVNVCSLVSYLGEPNQMVYASAKAALGTLTRSIALEAGPAGVRCNAVSPGIIASRFVEKYRADEFGSGLTDQIERTPLRRVGRPDEVASVIAFLAGEDASFVTGETIAVGGGVYLRP